MEMKVQNVIKNLALTYSLVMTVLIPTIQGQTKYFVVDDTELNKAVHLQQYTLPTKALYGIEKEVKIFNFIYPYNTGYQSKDVLAEKKDYNLILFSILPDLQDRGDWQEVVLDSIQKNIVSLGFLKQLFELNTMSIFDKKYGEKNMYFNEYKIVQKKGSKYFAANNCLLQFYAVRNRPLVFSAVFGTISTQWTPLPVLTFEKIFRETFPKSEFPLYRIGDSPYSYHSGFDRLRDRREYLSKSWRLPNGQTLYQFWTYTDWHVHLHEYEFNRGIDRFVYLPGKGIVGGSFDFYFYFHRKKLPITYTDFLNNIKEEKVMMAEELSR